MLHRFCVKPECKRQGIGTALLAAVEADLRAKGRTAALVHMGEPREVWFESNAFYPKHGYAKIAPRQMRKEL